MTCRAVRKLLPLAAGGDLPEARAGKIAAHCEGCASCRAELEAYRSAIERARGLDAAAGRSWREPDWSRAVRRAIAQEPRPAAARPRLALRTALVAGAGVILVAVIALMLVLDKSPLEPRRAMEAHTMDTGDPDKSPAPVVTRPVPGREPESVPAQAPSGEPTARRGSIQEPGTELLAAGNATPSPAPIDRALPGAAAAPAPPPGPVQDVVSVTFVSQETGLKIVWFFDRNFSWKGEGK